MFILNVIEMNKVVYAKGLKVESDIKLLYTNLGQINVRKQLSMQLKGVMHDLLRKIHTMYVSHMNRSSISVLTPPLNSHE